jgi:hypothetical protein
MDFLIATGVIAASIGLGLTLTQGVFFMVFRLARIGASPERKNS